MNRRHFLTSFGTATAAACGLGRRRLAPGAGGPAVGPVGLQLYTVRGEMRRDVPGTLARVAAIGYTQVEFAGYFGLAPTEVRRLLAEHGLTAPSSHLAFDLLAKDWARTLDEAKTVGHTWATIPWLPAEARRTADDWKRTADALNRGAEQARAAGLRFAYHNHDFELAPVGGTTGLEILLGATDPALVDYEMDVYWVTKAGGDPLALMARHPGRWRMLHLKDAGPAPARRMTSVGAGTIDWKAVLARREAAGVRHVFVEHDEPTDAFASARASYEYLASLK